MSELGKSAIRQRPAGRRITLRRCSSPNLRLSDWCFASTVDMAKLQIALLTLALLTLAGEACPVAAATRSQCHGMYEICSPNCPEAPKRLHHPGRTV